MKFWDYDFILKVLYIICVTVAAIVFGSPWVLLAWLFTPLVET